jgi:hypothetical protein
MANAVKARGLNMPASFGCLFILFLLVYFAESDLVRLMDENCVTSGDDLITNADDFAVILIATAAANRSGGILRHNELA